MRVPEVFHLLLKLQKNYSIQIQNQNFPYSDNGILSQDDKLIRYEILREIWHSLKFCHNFNTVRDQAIFVPLSTIHFPFCMFAAVMYKHFTVSQISYSGQNRLQIADPYFL